MAVTKFKSDSVELLTHLVENQSGIVLLDQIHPFLPKKVWSKIVTSISDRSTCILLGDATQSEKYHDHLLNVCEPDYDKIIELVDSFNIAEAPETGELAAGARRMGALNVDYICKLLENNNCVAIISIDLSSFDSIGIEYGHAVYNEVIGVAEYCLEALWGQPGSFRSTDILCRDNRNNSRYHIILNRARSEIKLPPPGMIEKISDRIGVNLQNLLWAELFKKPNERMLPKCIRNIPSIGIGYSSTIHNPNIDRSSAVTNILERAMKVSTSQSKRFKNRQRELIQTLIQGKNLLTPHYQGIFNLQDISEDMLKKSQDGIELSELSDSLHSFESLIRVQSDEVAEILDYRKSGIINPKFLRPDVLFAIAIETKVALELDQACVERAISHSQDLPGRLLVNLLPRNLYHIDMIQKLIGNRQNVIFEISESEAISNFELMLKVREELNRRGLGIAADDFGRGFAGLERIIKIRPDIIKFDRSLIEGIHKDKVKESYLNGLISAAKLLNTEVLAEGVELWEEAVILKKMGVNYIQGFLLHRPQSAKDIQKSLNSIHEASKGAA